MKSDTLLNEQKRLERQLARQRRERAFRRRLAAMSWTLPVMAFGSFFSIWHSLSSTVSPTTAAKLGSASASHTAKVVENVAPKVLFHVGSSGPQVAALQQQLSKLGYFTHVVTAYYGPVTEQAVKSFQAVNHLKVTGKIDSTTLAAIQQTLKDYQTSNLMNSNISNSKSTSNYVIPSNSQSPPPTVSVPPTTSPQISQQTVPQTTSSAS